jgi:hypothetical protein
MRKLRDKSLTTGYLRPLGKAALTREKSRARERSKRKGGRRRRRGVQIELPREEPLALKVLPMIPQRNNI